GDAFDWLVRDGMEDARPRRQRARSGGRGQASRRSRRRCAAEDPSCLPTSSRPGPAQSCDDRGAYVATALAVGTKTPIAVALAGACTSACRVREECGADRGPSMAMVDVRDRSATPGRPAPGDQVGQPRPGEITLPPDPRPGDLTTSPAPAPLERVCRPGRRR